MGSVSVNSIGSVSKMQEQEPVVIVDYNPDWPAMYEQEKERIVVVIGNHIKDIQHIGSTSIAELAAKPVIDIMIGISDLALVEQCVEPLQKLGYIYMGEHGIPHRHFFYRDVAGKRAYHIHMMETNHDQWYKMLVFRDYLRLHPEDARAYGELKKELARQYGSDSEGYIDAKASFVEAILVKALLAE